MPGLTRTFWRLAPLSRYARCGRQTDIRWNSSIAPKLRENVPAIPTKIEKLILEHIKTTGPISFATYMQLCLSHPTDGYYMNPANKVFGTGGDFITSPEISQTFGELIALWLLQEYKKSGTNLPLRMIELGPGKGTLMGDILRVIQKFEPRIQLNVHLVETSPAMRDQQKTHLSTPARPNVQLHWHNSIGEILPSPSEYTMLVAHEFFDALPIHILHKSKETGFWHEVLIASNEKGVEKEVDDVAQPSSHSSAETPTAVENEVPINQIPLETPTSPETPSRSLRRVLAAKPSSVGAVLGLSSLRFADLAPGTYLEVSPTSFRIARKVSELLASGQGEEECPSIGGCGLIIDYGGAKAYEDSLRAFKNHEIVDVFQEPGNCDITANVDFAFLKEAMADLVKPLGPISQGSFLTRMGLGLRLRTLLQAAGSEDRQQVIHGAAMRLIDPKRMGGQYQVLGITNQNPKNPGPSIEDPWPFGDDPKY